MHVGGLTYNERKKRGRTDPLNDSTNTDEASVSNRQGSCSHKARFLVECDVCVAGNE